MADDCCLYIHADVVPEKSHSLLKVTPEVHARVKELADQLNRQPMSVASELLTWAMDRTKITRAPVSPPSCDPALVEAVANEVIKKMYGKGEST